MESHGYLASAFDSRKRIGVKPKNNACFVSRLHSQYRQPLAWSKLTGQVPEALLSHWTPDDQRSLDNHSQQTRSAWWDHQSLERDEFRPFFHLVMKLSALGSLICRYSLVTLLAVCVAMYLENLRLVASQFPINQFVLGYLGVVCLPGLVMWKLPDCLPLFGLGNPYQRKYSLNRRSGVVSLYHRGKRVYEHPFWEFDAYINGVVDRYGFIHYSLYLVHRYGDYYDAVPVSDLLPQEQTKESLIRLWNMLQQYMDISRPLPDIVLLEPYRPYDATTYEADKRQQRPARYWRNMPAELFERRLRQFIGKQSQLPLGSNI